MNGPNHRQSPLGYMTSTQVKQLVELKVKFLNVYNSQSPLCKSKKTASLRACPFSQKSHNIVLPISQSGLVKQRTVWSPGMEELLWASRDLIGYMILGIHLI